MIRDDDLAWANVTLNGTHTIKHVEAVLARLVLHVHEQDTAAKNEEAYEVLKAHASSPPPEAVAWARGVVDDVGEHTYAEPVYYVGEYAAARFILTAAGKDTEHRT